jgi:pimeloyl-ACP methyl ester carboxylesterase
MALFPIEPDRFRNRAAERLVPPRVEGTLKLRDGRRLGFAEFGPARGRPVFWFHGTPGARRQIPDGARMAAHEQGVRLIGIDRPGVGASTPHLYDRILDWADDFAVVADRLGVDDCALIGLSGGGPYALACCAAMPDRITAAAVLGGVAPAQGPDALPGGLVGRTMSLAPLLTRFRTPSALALTGFVWALRPVVSQVFELYARISPEGDRRVFARPEMKAMFLDDILSGSKPGMQAPVFDIILFWRPWGFSLRDLRVPIHFWHGDADNIVPLAHGEHMASLVPGAAVTVRPGESHLGGFAAAEEVLDKLFEMWETRAPAVTTPRTRYPEERGG